MFYNIVPALLLVISSSVILVILSKRVFMATQDIDKEALLKSSQSDSNSKINTIIIKNKAIFYYNGLIKKTKNLINGLTNKVRTLKAKEIFKKDKKEFQDDKDSSIEEKKILQEKAGLKSSLLDDILHKKQDKIEKRKKKNQVDLRISKELRSLLKNETSFKQNIFLQRMSELRDKIVQKTEKAIQKKGLFPIKKVKKKIIDIEEVKKVMFQRQEQALIKKISFNTKDDASYVELGKLYKGVNNLRDAEASFRQALKINKGNIVAKKNLKKILEGR